MTADAVKQSRGDAGMIREERLLKVLKAPHISEKSTTGCRKAEHYRFKVAKDATKAEIKAAVRNCSKSKLRPSLP
jgi:large subunit ribosomal protein L23